MLILLIFKYTNIWAQTLHNVNPGDARSVCLKFILRVYIKWSDTLSSSRVTLDAEEWSPVCISVEWCQDGHWKLSHRLWDIRLLSIPWPWNSGYGSLKVIKNYTNWSGTHDFLLMFHSHHHPILHLFRDIGHFRWKSSIFPTPVYI